MENPQWFLDELCRTLSMLASPADKQIAYLENMAVGPVVDELALEYDDVSILVPQLVERDKLTSSYAEAVRVLDQKLGEMSGSHNAHLWTIEALQNSPHWAEARRLAAAIVKELDCS